MTEEQRTKIEEVLARKGWNHEPGIDSWVNGAIVIDFVNDKCQITMPFEFPICGSGDTLSEMMECARQSLRKISNQNKMILKTLSMQFRNAEQSCEEETDNVQ